MTDPHPLMALILDHNSFLGKSESVQDTIMPLDGQLNLDVGDTAMLATANTPLEHTFTVLQVLDPKEFVTTYPDWEERVGPNAHVLCMAFSREDPEMTMGWYSRVKMLPIPRARYEEALLWLESGDFPEEIPDWAMEIFHDFTDQLSERAPDVVPKSVECPECHKRNVELVIRRRTEYRVKAGVITQDGQERYVPVSDPDETNTVMTKLRCIDCGIDTEALKDEEWMVPNDLS